MRYMTRQGASVTGLECGELQLAKARSYPSEGDEVYLEGVGQAMPFNDGDFGAVTFFKSLHHVPPEHMVGALAEAMRVITSAGTVYVAEPIASGTGFEPVDAIIGLVDGPGGTANGTDDVVVDRRPLGGRLVNVLDPQRLLARAVQVIEKSVVGADAMQGVQT